MGNRWKEIWNKRDIASAVAMQENQDEFLVYTQLKKIDGFDTNITDEKAYYRHFYDATLHMWEEIQNRAHIESVYEVGCGSGANLYLLKNRGLKVGGMDYSGKLIEAAQKALGGAECLKRRKRLNLHLTRNGMPLYQTVFSLIFRMKRMAKLY